MKFAFFIFIAQIYWISCDLLEDARDQLESLDVTIKNSVQKTEEIFVSALDLVLDSETTFYSDEFKKLIIAYDDVDTSLALLQEAADNSTIDLSGCFTNADILSSLYKTATDSITNCMKNSIKSCKSLVTDSLYLVNDAYNQVQAIRSQLDSCNSNDQDCAQSVLDNVASSATNLPELISVNVGNFQETLVDLQKTSKTCADSSFEIFVQGSNTTLNDISSCIEINIKQ